MAIGKFSENKTFGLRRRAERRYDEFVELGIDQVICVAVNGAFVMFQWAKSREIEKVFMLPDR